MVGDVTMSKQEQIDMELAKFAVLKKELFHIKLNGVIGSKVGRRIQENLAILSKLGVDVEILKKELLKN